LAARHDRSVFSKGARRYRTAPFLFGSGRMVSPASRVYLRPTGLLHGESARSALAAGWALPLHDERCAFTACDVWLRDGGRIDRHTVAVADLRAWAARAGKAGAADIEQTLVRLTTPSTTPPGLPGEDRPWLMGVVNVTPDSFSDGGLFYETERAIAHGRKLWQEGAVVVDVGGESTRPGAEAIPAAEEIRRVVPVVRALAEADVLVSIDTRKAEVMSAAIDAGARMINDISALRHDPDSLALAARSGLPVVLMHSRGDPATMQDRPTYERAVLDVYDHLKGRIDACLAAGMERHQLLIDPGIGFGKILAHNLDILGNLAVYHGLGVPVVLGASRKSFIARLAGEAAVDERLPGSLAAAMHGIVNHVSMVRVHDVASTRQAVRVLDALMV